MAPFIHDLRTAVVAFPTASHNAATTTSHIKILTGLDPIKPASLSASIPIAVAPKSRALTIELLLKL